MAVYDKQLVFKGGKLNFLRAMLPLLLNLPGTTDIHDGVPMMHRPLCITKLANQGNNSASYVDHTKDVIGRFTRNACVCKY